MTFFFPIMHEIYLIMLRQLVSSLFNHLITFHSVIVYTFMSKKRLSGGCYSKMVKSLTETNPETLFLQ